MSVTLIMYLWIWKNELYLRHSFCGSVVDLNIPINSPSTSVTSFGYIGVFF